MRVTICLKDCGTGAGGFKPGNTCASGRDGGGGGSSVGKIDSSLGTRKTSLAEGVARGQAIMNHLQTAGTVREMVAMAKKGAPKGLKVAPRLLGLDKSSLLFSSISGALAGFIVAREMLGDGAFESAPVKITSALNKNHVGRFSLRMEGQSDDSMEIVEDQIVLHPIIAATQLSAKSITAAATAQTLQRGLNATTVLMGMIVRAREGLEPRPGEERFKGDIKALAKTINPFNADHVTAIYAMEVAIHEATHRASWVQMRDTQPATSRGKMAAIRKHESTANVRSFKGITHNSTTNGHEFVADAIASHALGFHLDKGDCDAYIRAGGPRIPNLCD